MATEKRADDQTWRARLDELKEVEGEQSWSAEAAWNKLENRFAEKENRKPAYWPWLAAAMLILVAGLLFMRRPAEHAMGMHVTDRASTHHTDGVSKPRPFGNEKYIVPLFVPKESLQVVENQHLNIIARKGVVRPLIHGVNQSQTPIITGSTAMIGDTASTTITVAATSPVIVREIKQKLRVVHINELSELRPPRNLAYSSASSDRKNSSEKNESVFRPSFFSAQNGNLLEIRVSPSN